MAGDLDGDGAGGGDGGDAFVGVFGVDVDGGVFF